MLERDGESSYYINNMHVRRRDVADIFLGTGLGGRAYAIIEQGMISRIVEARPEELRTFLEEAAGISKYRERRKETEQRLEDTRENLARVDDILQELTTQLTHLEVQAEVAGRYRALEADLKLDAAAAVAAAQAGCGRQPHPPAARAATRLRSTWKPRRRACASWRAGSRSCAWRITPRATRVHAAQGAHVRSQRGDRPAGAVGAAPAREPPPGGQSDRHGVAGAQEAERPARRAADRAGRAAHRPGERALSSSRRAASRSGWRRSCFPLPSRLFTTTRSEAERLSQDLARHRQEEQVELTRQDHAAKVLAQLGQRRERLVQERQACEDVDRDELDRLTGELRELDYQHREKRDALAQAEAALPELERTIARRPRRPSVAARELSALDARKTALELLQRQVSRSGEMHAWLDDHQLDGFGRLWQGIRIEPGWEDALEAVLRERLNGIAVEDLQRAARLAAASAARQGVVLPEAKRRAAGRHPAAARSLLSRLHHVHRCRRGRGADRLARTRLRGGGRRCRLRPARASSPPGDVLVCPQGHVFTRSSVSFHAADSEIHGILSRQREIEELKRPPRGPGADPGGGALAR